MKTIIKTIIKILILVSLTSCTKDWVCTAVTSNGTITSTTYSTFEGTTQEKNEFEQSGQVAAEALGMTQTVTCVPE